MTKQKQRSEINEEYKWDLTKIFKNKNEFLKEVEDLKKHICDIKKYKGNITKSAKSLLEFLEYQETIERRLYKCYYYAHLNYDSDTTNSVYQEYKGKVDYLINEYEEASSFVNPELYEKEKEEIDNYIKEEKNLEKYKHNFQNFYRAKKHKLTEEEEVTLSYFSSALASPEETMENLTDTDLTFPTIKDEKNKEVELTESNYSIYIRSKNRRVRKMAFQKLLTTYGNYKNTLASTFQGNIDCLIGNRKLRKFNSTLEASLFIDNIDKKVYENLIEVTHKNLNILFEYYKLKKEVLKLDELHLYDTYTSMVDEVDKKYTFENAKEIVINALSILGDDYVSNIQKAFDEKWIDVYNNKGKRGGAYSSGFYDTNPYILLNFEGNLNDVSTLAHELGHSMHTYYSCKNNTYNNSSYSIFVAEVASIVNELLINKYLLKQVKNKKEKLSIINHLLDLFKSTIYRQVMFCEFEKNMHEVREQGNALTSEFLCNEYYKLNQTYFGTDVVVDDEIKYEWERIPHFYYDFYVYKYATGLACACYIVNRLEYDEKEKEDYIKFLSSGGSDYPVNELKLAKVDITKKEVLNSAFQTFKELIEEFKNIYKN